MSVEVSTRVWKNSTHRGTTLVTLLALADFANPHGICWPGMEMICAYARTKLRQIQEIYNELEASGELYIHRGGGRGNTSHYAVLTGLAASEIAEILVEYFGLSAIEAHQIAQEKVDAYEEKVHSAASFLQKVQSRSVKGAAQRREKVHSGSKKGALQRTKKVHSSVNGGAILPFPTAQTDSDPSLRSTINDPPPDPPSDPPEVEVVEEEDMEAFFKRIGL